MLFGYRIVDYPKYNVVFGLLAWRVQRTDLHIYLVQWFNEVPVATALPLSVSL